MLYSQEIAVIGQSSKPPTVYLRTVSLKVVSQLHLLSELIVAIDNTKVSYSVLDLRPEFNHLG